LRYAGRAWISGEGLIQALVESAAGR